jgi:hypothetical protein
MLTVREIRIRQATPAAYRAVDVLVRRRHAIRGLDIHTESHYAAVVFRWVGAAGVPRGFPTVNEALAANGT